MIVVCGEALVDIVRDTSGSERTVPGGGPFNTARALARLGVPAAFLGRLSLDRFGLELAGLLKADGASLELVSVGPEPTTIAVAEVDSTGAAKYEFQVDGTSAPNLTIDMLPDRLGPGVGALHVGTLGLVLEPMASTLADLVRRQGHGRLVMLDPNIRVGLGPDDEYRARLNEVTALSTIVKASDQDLCWLHPGSSYERAAEAMLEHGVRLVVVTLGAGGAFAAHGDHRVRAPAVPAHVVDTIGAGDAFGAALLAWLHYNDRVSPDLEIREDELRSALDYACLAAAITSSRAGADPPTKAEMVAALR